jgi:hypothetical protein
MGSDIRPVVPRRRSRLAAVTAVLTLLLAAPIQRGRDCDVCPVDCPMHAAKSAPRGVGCHHGGADAPPRLAPADDGACAMRASCGHRGSATMTALQLELPAAVALGPIVACRAIPVAWLDPHVAEAPAPRDRPPKTDLV